MRESEGGDPEVTHPRDYAQLRWELPDRRT